MKLHLLILVIFFYCVPVSHMLRTISFRHFSNSFSVLRVPLNMTKISVHFYLLGS